MFKDIEARRAYDREWRRKWREKNPGLNKELQKKWREKNPELNKESKRKWTEKNREKINKKWNDRYTKRYKNDFNFKIAKNVRNRINKSLAGINRSSKILELLGVASINELRNHIESQFKEGMTWENHSVYGWHIDHIVPISSFNLRTKKGQKEAFNYKNLQPLWWEENLQKGSKKTKTN